MNIMTFVSTELPTHCLYINVYAELPTQVERYFTTLRFIFFDKGIFYYVSRLLHWVDTINWGLFWHDFRKCLFSFLKKKEVTGSPNRPLCSRVLSLMESNSFIWWIDNLICTNLEENKID